MSTQEDYQQDNANHILQGTFDFLQALRPGGPWVLVAIDPDSGGIMAITARSSVDVAGFLNRHNGTWNCYYSLNPTRTAMTKKPTKGDIAAIEYILVDLDPRDDETPAAAKQRYLSQLETFQPQPFALVDSGNGIQAAWKLRPAVALGAPPTRKGKNGKWIFPAEDQPKVELAEALSKALMEHFGSAAGTQNIDRVLRLPGTINLPNEPKRKAGRVKCEARLVRINAGATAAFADFPKVKPSAEEPKKKERKPREKGELPSELKNMLYLTGSKPIGPYESRSELLWAFIKTALRKGIDENDIVAATLDETYSAGGLFQHVEEKGGEEYIKTQIEKAINDDDLPKGEKRLIRIKDGQLDLQWRATEAALIAAKCPVFVRGGSLVQPLWRFEDTGGEDNKQVLSAGFVKFNIPRLRDVVAHHAAAFQKYDRKQKSWRFVNPPNEVIETLLEAGHWGFPNVAGIITTPTMRRDGSLITEPGYDRATQLWYKPAGNIQLGTICETEDEAKAALAELKELIEECPFVGDVDRSVALAAMLTVVLRGAFTMTPMFFFHKPEPGTGGSYLVKIISTLALGREAPSLHVNEDKKEFAKELSAAASEAKPILNIGNLTFDLVSALLSQMIEGGYIAIRPFGKNTETVSCDCRYITVIVNGNNVRPVGELVRRTLTGRLDTKMERPETKKYKGKPIAAIQSDRSKYLRAVLTIARAYLKLGEVEKKEVEKKAQMVNGLEEWSRFVQQPLVWLGEADPTKSQDDARARDPERGAVRERIMAIIKYFQGHESFGAKDVYELASKTSGFPNHSPIYSDLFNAFSSDGRVMSSKSIGWLLTKDEGRVVGPFSIQIAKDTSSNNEAKAYVIMPRPPTKAKPNGSGALASETEGEPKVDGEKDEEPSPELPM